MEHRGYTGSVEYDAREGIFHGRVLDLRDTVTYEADCEARLEAAFRDAVDEYLDHCWACETEPEPPPARDPGPTVLQVKRIGPGECLPARSRLPVRGAAHLSPRPRSSGTTGMVRVRPPRRTSNRTGWPGRRPA